jgi:hypothetical protein
MKWFFRAVYASFAVLCGTLLYETSHERAPDSLIQYTLSETFVIWILFIGRALESQLPGKGK